MGIDYTLIAGMCFITRQLGLLMKAEQKTGRIDRPPSCGATGIGSSGYIIPKIINEILGARIKLVSGYQGGKEVDLAVERGEINCSGITISSHFGREPLIRGTKKGFDLHLLQTMDKRDARLMGTPTIYELIDHLKTTDLKRRAVSCPRIRR